MKKLSLAGVCAVLAVAVGIGGCTSKQQIQKVIEQNPDIVFSAIKKDPKKFVDVVNEAVRAAREQAAQDEAKQEQAQIEQEFKNPMKPIIDKDSVTIFGSDKAPVTIVEYSDFQCPYCGRAYHTVKELEKDYGDKIRVIYKNLPLEFHPMAMPAAKYFTAIAMQSPEKASKFYDEVFSDQTSLVQDGDKFLNKVSKKVGANMGKLKKALNSSAVQKRIQADMDEAKKFDFQGTPGFLINGVALKGAYPIEDFKKIIDRHLASAGQAPTNTEKK